MMLSVCSGVYSLCKEVKKMPHKVPHTHSSTETCLSLEKDAYSGAALQQTTTTQLAKYCGVLKNSHVFIHKIARLDLFK